MFRIYLVLLIVLLSPSGQSSEITVKIIKHSTSDWRAIFSASTPVNKLVFQRSSDDSRSKRWQAMSAEYQIQFNNGSEQVSRLDGQPFREVSFVLTPTYIVLPKDYAPFSPFSDQGMLLHTGRFFACAEFCDPALNQWRIQVQVPVGEHIIAAGKIYPQQANLLSKDSGAVVYLGAGAPSEDVSFVSVIDAGLPQILRQQIDNQLPKLMRYFRDKMAALDYRPELYASFSATQDGSYGHQGGTLPGQIFMHWYGQKALDTLQADAVFWFFAHEVAHLYQGNAGNIERVEESWIHEGAAEFFAGIASAEINHNPLLLQRRLALASKDCLAGLQQDQNYQRQSATNAKLHYSCGLLLMHAIHLQLLSQSKGDLFSLWTLFNAAVQQGQPPAASTFLAVSKAYLSVELWQGIHLLATSAKFDALLFFKQLAQVAGDTSASN